MKNPMKWVLFCLICLFIAVFLAVYSEGRFVSYWCWFSAVYCSFAAGYCWAYRITNRLIEGLYVDGETPDDERRNIFRALNEHYIDYLCNVQVVERGTDIPRIGCVATLYPFVNGAGHGGRYLVEERETAEAPY